MAFLTLGGYGMRTFQIRSCGKEVSERRSGRCAGIVRCRLDMMWPSVPIAREMDGFDRLVES